MRQNVSMVKINNKYSLLNIYQQNPNMEKIILISIGITILFVLFKYIEAHYLEKTTLSIKLTTRNIIMVFCSSFLSLFVYNSNERFFTNCIHTFAGTPNSLTVDRPNVFTGEPDF